MKWMNIKMTAYTDRDKMFARSRDSGGEID